MLTKFKTWWYGGFMMAFEIKFIHTIYDITKVVQKGRGLIVLHLHNT